MQVSRFLKFRAAPALLVVVEFITEFVAVAFLFLAIPSLLAISGLIYVKDLSEFKRRQLLRQSKQVIFSEEGARIPK